MTVEERYLAFPKLMGAPAYARPPSAAEPATRPFDPDELPILAQQTPEERALLGQLGGSSSTRPEIVVAPWPPEPVPVAASSSPTSRAPAATAVPPSLAPDVHRGAGAGATGGPTGTLPTDRHEPAGALAAHPFSLRDLTDRLRGRR